jgi:hypothetical protein
MSSQVSVVCRNHGWLEVEEEEECTSWEKREVKIEKPSPHITEDKGAGYISEDRERAKEVVHAQQL